METTRDASHALEGGGGEYDFYLYRDDALASTRAGNPLPV